MIKNRTSASKKQYLYALFIAVFALCFVLFFYSGVFCHYASRFGNEWAFGWDYLIFKDCFIHKSIWALIAGLGAFICFCPKFRYFDWCGINWLKVLSGTILLFMFLKACFMIVIYLI